MKMDIFNFHTLAKDSAAHDSGQESAQVKYSRGLHLFWHLRHDSLNTEVSLPFLAELLYWELHNTRKFSGLPIENSPSVRLF